MAEEAPAVQNKGMLIMALVLGTLVVVVYNWQIERVRQESKGETVWLARADRDLKAGEKIDLNKDFVLQEASKQFQGTLGNVVVLKNRDTEPKTYNGNVLKRAVASGHYLTFDDIQGEQADTPSSKIDVNRVAVAVPVRDAVGDTLHPGDRVNLVGRFNIKGEAKTYRIVEGVTVLGIGGRGIRESFNLGKGYGTSDEGQTNYRIITIEVTKPVSLQLDMVLAHVPAGVKVEVLNPKATLPATAGEVSKELLDLINAIPLPKSGS